MPRVGFELTIPVLEWSKTRYRLTEYKLINFETTYKHVLSGTLAPHFLNFELEQIFFYINWRFRVYSHNI